MDDITTLHEAIEPMMARLAAGDRTAIWDLHRIARPHLRSMRHREVEGNRAPAVTVGADHGMRPDAIRKVVQRVQPRAVPVAA